MKHTLFIVAIALTALSGCAGMGQPSVEQLRDLPVVRFGDPVPAGKDYILYFPAGQPIPTAVTIKGNLFERNAEDSLSVALRQDIFSYKDWFSYDRVNWLNGRKDLELKVEVRLPGYRHPKPGNITVEFNDKHQP